MSPRFPPLQPPLPAARPMARATAPPLPSLPLSSLPWVEMLFTLTAMVLLAGG